VNFGQIDFFGISVPNSGGSCARSRIERRPLSHDPVEKLSTDFVAGLT
jgi:hypothetical protein